MKERKKKKKKRKKERKKERNCDRNICFIPEWESKTNHALPLKRACACLLTYLGFTHCSIASSIRQMKLG
jgi:hypothetical protein